MWQEYQSKKAAIEVPDFLIQDTLVKMDQLDKQIASRSGIQNLAMGILILSAVFLNFRGLAQAIGGGNPSRIPGEPMVFESNGYCTILNFEDMREVAEVDDIEVILSLVEGGGRVVITPPQGSGQQLTVEDFESVTEVALSQFSFSGFVFTGMTWYLDEDGHAHGTYSFTRGEQRAQIGLDSSGPPFIGNSLLEDREIGLFVVDDIYIATFVEDGILYQVVITEVSESEFIGYLQEVIEFVERSVR